MAAASLPISPNSCLLTILDSKSGHVFLVDTGAQVSVVPVHSRDPSCCTPHNGPTHLRLANGSTIKVHYSTNSTLHFVGRRFTAHLLHAEVSLPLLGADFLREHHLLVDVWRHHLWDARNW